MPYVPLEWLGEHAEVPAGLDVPALAAALVKVGLEEEEIHAAAVTGDLVVGRVLSLVKETHSNGKTVNYCRVDVGPFNDAPGTGKEKSELASRGIICGAHNFEVGDHVVVALPGTVLPGPFAIAARKTYGHVSDGMICSERELGLGEDHGGIIVLERRWDEIPEPGTNVLPLLGLGEELLEINVTPDRGYCFSMRGVAREFSHSTGAAFVDPASRYTAPEPTADGFRVEVRDDSPIHGQVGCDRFVTRVVRGIDPNAASPEWMVRRLRQAGMRPISLAVDISNYVMLDLGQPMHAYDLAKMREPIVVRRAAGGETLVTLDDVERTLDPEDLLITDDDGARVLALAGVMGGASTEIDEGTSDVLLEAAHFDPITVARTARRHKLPSEAAKRFERGVDPQLPAVAAQRAAELLVEFGGGTIDTRVFDLNEVRPPSPISFDPQQASRLVGVPYTDDEVAETLRLLGAEVAEGEGLFQVTPPTWRSDLRNPEDLIEEVVRLRGYDQVPSVVPTGAVGTGLTRNQQQRRAVIRTLAEHGLNEVLSYPFVGDIYDRIEVPEGDPRRAMVKLANPIADDAPFMRSTLLASLLDAARRNAGRGNDVALVEIGMVTEGKSLGASPLPAVGTLPASEDLDAIHATVPNQPLHVAGVAGGTLARGGILGATRRVDWADAIELAQLAGSAIGVTLTPSAADLAPWHPGRCAALSVGDVVIGYAGELHPRAVAELGLPERSVAFELDLDALFAAADPAPIAPKAVSTHPLAKEDIALVMDAAIPNGEALAVVRAAAGDVAEEVRIFDEYRSEALGGKKSLAFALRMRADHTLSAEETAAVRQAVLDAAADKLGATLR
ncbi:phenylalanyl-tRNA synthetase beta subunit [Ruaniaceae bacterium KH17]|nr:phenylalanyl-tRNA synthetase beta subunit [Ruaniaceae bacterium KH17]